jgi:hypothetical protein
MRIIEAEPELVKDMLEEIELAESKDRGPYAVHVGHHPMLGRVVIILAVEGVGTIVELD